MSVKVAKSPSVKDYTIVVVGSHSALDVCRGAKDEGFKTLVIVESGRDQTYAKYFKTQGEIGCVDEVLYVDRFHDILSTEIQKQLIAKNTIFIPHRSFEVYINDYGAIEKDFKVPVFGNKYILRIEERNLHPNQYDLLEKAEIKFPVTFKKPEDIDRLVIVKVAESQRKFERAFFLASSAKDYKVASEILMLEGKITEEALNSAVIEEFVLGAQVNFNFFRSMIHNRLELIGTDTRRQTNLDGLLRLPAFYQNQLQEKLDLKYEEAGHIAVTTLESLLEPAYAMGERFISAASEFCQPGIIGPFGLQAVITAGPPKKDIVVFDVSPRMPGSPGISATPYSAYLFGKSISMGRRLALEIRESVEKNQLSQITT